MAYPITELLALTVSVYVVYRQETIENSIRELRKEVAELRRVIPKRWTDKLIDRIDS